jgi:ABC-2 type transport system permease protein
LLFNIQDGNTDLLVNVDRWAYLINLPLLFASNALFPIKLMPTWLQNIAMVNPVSYANDAVRQLLLGSVGMASLWVDFGVLVGFAALFSIIGIILSWKLLSK